MTLSIRGDISPNGITFTSALATGTTFLATTTETKIRKYLVNNTSMIFTASAALSGTSPSSMELVAPASGVISYGGSSRFDVVDINTLALTAITTNATPTFRSTSQQIAGYTSPNLVLATSSTTGRLSMVSLTCCAPINPTVLTGQTARCVTTKPDSGTWLFGTSNGKIHEINSAGSILTTVNVPSAPFVTSPTICVESISYYNSKVLVCTDAGEALLYSWPTGTLIHRTPMFMSNSSSVTTVLCKSLNGTTLMTNQGTLSTNGKGIEEVFFNASAICTDSVFFNETSAGISEVGIEPTGLFAWTIQSTSTNLIIRIFDISSMVISQCGTRAMDPLGSDIAARIIRIRDDGGIGNATVELDQTIFPGFAGLQATDSRNYIEIAVKGNIVNGNPPYTAWDIREFQA